MPKTRNKVIEWEASDMLKDLRDVFIKHGAFISCDDHWEGYAECGQDLRITIEFNDYTKSDIEFGICLGVDEIKAKLGDEK